MTKKRKAPRAKRGYPRKRKRGRLRGGRITVALRRFIIESGLTHKELSKKIKVDLSTIYRLFQGQGMTLATVDRIAKVLGLELRRRKGKIK